MNDFTVSKWVRKDEASDLADQMLFDRSEASWHSSNRNKQDKSLTVVVRTKSPDVLMSMRLTFAGAIFNELVEAHPRKAGGRPVLAGTRFKVAQIIGELADGKSVGKLAREFNLDKEKIVQLLRGMAIKLDRPFI
jgi:uncharacterized protein (DUF433 family)